MCTDIATPAVTFPDNRTRKYTIYLGRATTEYFLSGTENESQKTIVVSIGIAFSSPAIRDVLGCLTIHRTTNNVSRA